MPDTNPKAARAVADGKLRLELIETALTHPLARVMAHGADKYGVRNWRAQPIHLRTYVAAMRRHTDAIADGEWFDPDSGEPHAAHVAACAQVILDAAAFGTLIDDTGYAECGVAANVDRGVKQPGTALCTADCGIARTHAVGVHALTSEYNAGQYGVVEEPAAEAKPPCNCSTRCGGV
jgi:hypothetical protein